MRTIYLVALLLIPAVAIPLLYLGLSVPMKPTATSTIVPLTEGGGSTSLTLRSVFEDGGKIPVKYTCDGDDVSPPLRWEGQPPGTAAYALLVEDPDAPMGTFTHWIIYNIPPELNSLPEGIPKEKRTKFGLQGMNDFRRIGYGGPCPPPGKPHRYFFKLFALDSPLDLPPGARRRDVLRAMEGHVLAKAQLVGMYGRG